MKVKRLSSSSRLPRWGNGTESTCQCIAARDTCSIPGLERSPGAGNGNLLQYSCLENPMDREAWRAIIQRGIKNQTRVSMSTRALEKFHKCSLLVNSFFVWAHFKSFCSWFTKLISIRRNLSIEYWWEFLETRYNLVTNGSKKRQLYASQWAKKLNTQP